MACRNNQGVIFVALFFCSVGFLFSSEVQEQGALINHIPITEFNKDETIKFQASIKEAVMWVRFYLHQPGSDLVQVRDMEKESEGTYLFRLDTARLVSASFEYHIAARMGNRVVCIPEGAPQAVFHVEQKGRKPAGPEQEIIQKKIGGPARLGLPVRLTGTILYQITTDDARPSLANPAPDGNLLAEYAYLGPSDFSLKVMADLSYQNAPLPGENKIDLNRFLFSIQKSGHTLQAGDLVFRESEFTIEAGGQRGIDYVFQNKDAYIHLFDVSAVRPRGFDGFGLPKPEVSVWGGAAGYSILNGIFSIKAIYVSGKDDPGQAVNAIYNSFYQRREGTSLAIVPQVRLWQGKLFFGGEYALSRLDNNLNDQAGAQSDHAWKAGGGLLLKNFHFNATYRHIGKNYGSLGFPFFANDRKGFELNMGFRLAALSVEGFSSLLQNNVEEDPSQVMVKGYNHRVHLNWAQGSKFNLLLGYERDEQVSSRNAVPIKEDKQNTNSFTGGIGFQLSPASRLNLSAAVSDLKFPDKPEKNSSSLGLILGGQFQTGGRFSLFPSAGLFLVKNTLSDAQTLNTNLSLVSEVFLFPRLLSFFLTGSFYQTDATNQKTGNTISLEGRLNLYLDRLIPIGRWILALRGNYSSLKTSGVQTSDNSVYIQMDISF